MSVPEDANAKWYVLQTYSGYEDKVASGILVVLETHGLRDLLIDIKIPKGEVEEFKDGKKKKSIKKLYPGYVFVKVILTDDVFHRIVTIRGCSGFIGDPPVPLTKSEIDGFGIDSDSPKSLLNVPYKLGDTVQVIVDSWDGVSGVVKKIDLKKEIVGVLVSMFGRETLVEFSLGDVQPIN